MTTHEAKMVTPRQLEGLIPQDPKVIDWLVIWIWSNRVKKGEFDDDVEERWRRAKRLNLRAAYSVSAGGGRFSRGQANDLPTFVRHSGDSFRCRHAHCESWAPTCRWPWLRANTRTSLPSLAPRSHEWLRRRLQRHSADRMDCSLWSRWAGAYDYVRD